MPMRGRTGSRHMGDRYITDVDEMVLVPGSA